MVYNSKSTKRLGAKKTAPKRVGIRQAEPNLRVWADPDFTGSNRRVRGNLGIRNLSSVSLNDTIESLRFTSTDPNATLVLFADTNYQGRFQVFKPSAAGVSDLADVSFDNLASSLVMANFNLTAGDIQSIQTNQLPPSNFAEILRIIRAGRIRRMARRKGLRK